MTRAASLRFQLVVALLAAAGLLSLLLYGTVRSVSEGAAVRTQDNILGASAISIIDEVRAEDGQVVVDIPYSALSMLGAVSDDRVFYRVLADGETITGYPDLPMIAPPEAPSEPRFGTASYLGEEVRIAAAVRRITVAGGSRTVVALVAQTINWRAATSASISNSAAALGIGFFLLAAILSTLAAHNAVRPLDRLASRMRSRGPRDLSPVRAQVPSELAPMLEALNSFMARLDAALTQSEEFIAEAAHRVRTPLATVRLQTEIALRAAENPESRAALRDVLRAVDESSRSAGQLLDHATVRLRSDRRVREPVDLNTLARAVVDALQPTAEMKDIALSYSPAQPAPALQGDKLLLDAALRNLLDNAIKYSPQDRRIDIDVRHEPGSARIEICDQGRGFPDTTAARRLLKPFERGDNARNVVGSGLGLSIAQEAALAHGGRIEIDANRGGPGACVSLILPIS